MKARLEAGLLFDTVRHGCVTVEGGGGMRVAGILWSKAVPSAAGFPVACKITRPPLIPPSRTPFPPTFPAPSFWLTPTTLQAYHISYKGPINILNPSMDWPQLLEQLYLSFQKQDTNSSHWKALPTHILNQILQVQTRHCVQHTQPVYVCTK